MEEAIMNRVTTSGLITFDLAEYYHRGERIIYDLKDNLFMGMILKEKDFREFLKGHDWTQYEGKNVAITCSEDAIVPIWAYMLLTLKLELHANCVVFGNLDDLEKKLFDEALGKVDFNEFTDKRVVVKGCGELPIPTSTYVELTRKLQPYVKSMMFGEPCSTVPLYKKPKV
jgi:hypothetical protein